MLVGVWLALVGGIGGMADKPRRLYLGYPGHSQGGEYGFRKVDVRASSEN